VPDKRTIEFIKLFHIGKNLDDINCKQELHSAGSAKLNRAIIGVEVDSGFGTRELVGKGPVPLLNGADDDEETETED
jgi:hypothetical protein